MGVLVNNVFTLKVGENLRTHLENALMAKTPTEDCIDDPTKCPYYPKGQEKQCSNTKSGIVSNCNTICREIFRGNSYSGRTIPACEIGCSYAENYFKGNELKLPGSCCLMNCQYTVWTHQAGNDKCNYRNGLGISIPELNNFGAGKACRMGCVIGN